MFLLFRLTSFLCWITSGYLLILGYAFLYLTCIILYSVGILRKGSEYHVVLCNVLGDFFFPEFISILEYWRRWWVLWAGWCVVVPLRAWETCDGLQEVFRCVVGKGMYVWTDVRWVPEGFSRVWGGGGARGH